MSEFTVTRESLAGAPVIKFDIKGDTMRAELDGATLYAEVGRDESADVRLTSACNHVLADISVRAPFGTTLTDAVADVGSALLWSHHRFVSAGGEINS